MHLFSSPSLPQACWYFPVHHSDVIEYVAAEDEVRALLSAENQCTAHMIKDGVHQRFLEIFLAGLRWVEIKKSPDHNPILRYSWEPQNSSCEDDSHASSQWCYLRLLVGKVAVPDADGKWFKSQFELHPESELSFEVFHPHELWGSCKLTIVIKQEKEEVGERFSGAATHMATRTLQANEDGFDETDQQDALRSLLSDEGKFRGVLC